VKKLKVNNISFIDYINLPDRSEYDYYLRYGDIQPFDRLNLGEFMDRSFGFIKEMQDLLNVTGLTWQTFFEQMESEVNRPKDELANIGLFHLQQTRLYCKEQIEFINKLERENLSSGTNAEEEMAGIEEFSIFRSFPQYDKIIKEWGMKYEEVEKMPYSRAFVKLKYDKVYSEFSNRLSKIRAKK